MSGCPFCKIVSGDIPSTKVHEDEEMIAFRDINPQAPVHILIVPRRHIASLGAAAEDDQALLGRLLLRARELAASEGLAEAGYRVVNNCGSQGGQTVDHIHFHLLGGRAMTWPPG